MAISFVEEYWVEKKSEKGTQSQTEYVRLGSVSGRARVPYHVRRDLVDFCRLVECVYRFVCVELGGVKIVGVYSKCGARVHEMMQ